MCDSCMVTKDLRWPIKDVRQLRVKPILVNVCLICHEKELEAERAARCNQIRDLATDGLLSRHLGLDLFNFDGGRAA
jgi:hypothetical protein